MDLMIRVEQQGDWKAVEDLTREAFWNIHERMVMSLIQFNDLWEIAA